MAPFSKTSSTRRRSHDLAWLITAPLALVALIITFVLISNPRTVGEWPLGALFLGLFVAANATVLIFEMRRGETIVSNVVDIPFVLALFYLPPVTLIIVRVLTAVIMQVRRKSTPVKFAFNVANLSAATSVAAAVVYAQGDVNPRTPEGWVVLAAGVFIASAVSLLAVVAVITVTQGGISRAGAARTALPALAVSLVNVPIGLVVLMVLQVTLWSILLIVALAGFFALAYRSYASSVRQHRTLTEIYDLTRSIAETPHDGTLSDVLLSRVRSLFQAEHASLWLPAQGRYPGGLPRRPLRQPRSPRRRTDPGEPAPSGLRRGQDVRHRAGRVRRGAQGRDPQGRREGRDRGAAARRLRGDRHARGRRPARRLQPLHRQRRPAARDGRRARRGRRRELAPGRPPALRRRTTTV